MMKVFEPLIYLLIRLRYPFSMPQDVATDLGLNLSNSLTFYQFMDCLLAPHQSPTNLIRFMPRDQAENAFRSAIRKEKFSHTSIFSYYFKGGWVEFVLHFDEHSRLRRLYIRHKNLKQQHEIPISS